MTVTELIQMLGVLPGDAAVELSVVTREDGLLFVSGEGMATMIEATADMVSIVAVVPEGKE